MNIITDKTRTIIEEEEKYTSFTTRVPYYPLVVSKAKGVKVIDIEGNEFIDFLSSAAVINTGHNHPAIVEAIKKQLDSFIHYTPAYMYHKPHTELTKKLIEITPGDFEKRVAFSLSGGGSVDGAIKAARKYTKRHRIISFFKAYHGASIGALSVSGYSTAMREGMGPLLEDVTFIPYPDSYRPQFNEELIKNSDACLDYLQNLFDTVLPANEVAAVILEPMQGDAGILLPPQEFYDRLLKMCREHNILIIADEVQTGFGRTGKMFACEHYNLEPDLIVLGKAIASGMPLSAIVGRKEILEAWSAPAHFINTAGNPISCVAALETIKVIEEEKLAENAEKQGELIKDFFNKIKRKYDCIGDVRGTGLLIGVDIIKDPISKERDQVKTAKICWRCWENGLILAFFASNVLRIAPPLVINEEDVMKALHIIENAISDVQNGLIPDSVLEEIKGW
ncbi:MAG: aminotransferase class III-fold pyridoxal phosphate-dependent enzyme [Eubacteriales bacterium]|nr:aminotransferase class III-fold pyridoxal phosphate-dependent enzyme [Eubacteriales bacterium]MDD4389229.1 aminotransferase class III-fold pyridoxal phosphate-dependent enzyme [Eubacteriales bacterium]